MCNRIDSFREKLYVRTKDEAKSSSEKTDEPIIDVEFKIESFLSFEIYLPFFFFFSRSHILIIDHRRRCFFSAGDPSLPPLTRNDVFRRNPRGAIFFFFCLIFKYKVNFCYLFIFFFTMFILRLRILYSILYN